MEQSLVCSYVLLNDNAVVPKKNNESDSGYDVTLLGISKTYGKTILCHTGLAIKPPDGYYFDLVPRSSIVKTGYIQTNGVGIIDADYRGEILVPLTKIDENAEDLKFPIRLSQLIPRKVYYMNMELVSNLNETRRSDKGFGSSGSI